jgi:hypothetical protein
LASFWRCSWNLNPSHGVPSLLNQNKNSRASRLIFTADDSRFLLGIFVVAPQEMLLRIV